MCVWGYLCSRQDDFPFWVLSTIKKIWDTVPSDILLEVALTIRVTGVQSVSFTKKLHSSLIDQRRKQLMVTVKKRELVGGANTEVMGKRDLVNV